MSDYFNHLKTKASAVGNHEFDFGLEFLHSYLSKVNHDILSANFIDKAKDEFPLKNQQKSQIYSFPIKTRNLFV
jgi:2',3'-cyclic-nucleotide 2'-phosphodiesterase (5'-nucleotidase family)